MEVKLTLHTPEVAIGENAKVCYGTKSILDGGRDITSSLVHGHGHLATLRFAYATFNIKDISIACQNQLVRSKHLDFMVESKRYCSLEKGDFKFITPSLVNDEIEKLMQEHFDKSLDLYKHLLKLGAKKEDARAVLPMNTSTKVNVTGNLQAYNDLFKLRLNKHTQFEIRTLAGMMYDLLADVYPQVFTKEHKEYLENLR